MCGIAGTFNARVAAADGVIERMTQAIAHRGPDGFGTFADREIRLGHRRLAIIDLSDAAAQPMRSADGRYAMTYNGELYNYRELRAELEAAGCRFVSASDSEVVLQAFAMWGTRALTRFNGMFAFGVWDARERRLTLARDRYGIKPLYVAPLRDGLAFGSEIAALLAHPELDARLDPAGLAEYAYFQNFLGDRTLFANVRSIAPGSILTVDADAPQGRTERYWEFRFAPVSTERDEESLVDELDGLLCTAVRRQLVADVEVGSFLSGGMDSGTVSTLAAAANPNLSTFTIGFSSPGDAGSEFSDESSDARALAIRLGTRHHERAIGPGDMLAAWPDIVRHLEEPRVGQSYPNYYASQLAARSVKVVLSGAGGDELFAGYPWRYEAALATRDFGGFVDALLGVWRRLVPAESFTPLVAGLGVGDGSALARAAVEDALRGPASLGTFDERLAMVLTFEAKTFLRGLLAIEDKLAMAFGLETRVPLLDNDLVDFALALPARYKVRSDGSKLQGKLLLRRCMERHVPSEVTSRRKQGFTGPDAAWFRSEAGPYVRSMLLDRSAALYRYLDFATVAPLVEQHFSGEANRRLMIWSLVSLALWFDTFLAPQTVASVS
jgi:asparagine synthase (glutamine-hydrolysing)